MNRSQIDLAGGKVLVVDDVPANIDVLRDALEECGANVFAATSGEVALKVVERSLPDLILLDVMMPGLDGFETCDRLKARAGTQDIPVIFLTARGEMEDIVEGFERGAVDYVTKPFNTTELLARVNTHLTIYRLQMALEEHADNIARMYREQESFLRHELRNRLGCVMGYTDMVLMEESLNERLRGWMTSVQEATVNTSELIDSMQSLQEFETGEFELRTNPLELDPLVKQVVLDLETMLGDRVKIEYENGVADSAIQGNANLLKGVFQNLIKNAVEHVAELGDAQQRIVRVNLATENRKAVIKVNNQGEPVPPEKLALFFEKFNSTRRRKGGTGLGTTYAYLVTKAHGGQISVASDRSQGTTVTVELPMNATSSASPDVIDP